MKTTLVLTQGPGSTTDIRSWRSPRLQHTSTIVFSHIYIYTYVHMCIYVHIYKGLNHDINPCMSLGLFWNLWLLEDLRSMRHLMQVSSTDFCTTTTEAQKFRCARKGGGHPNSSRVRAAALRKARHPNQTSGPVGNYTAATATWDRMNPEIWDHLP